MIHSGLATQRGKAHLTRTRMAFNNCKMSHFMRTEIIGWFTIFCDLQSIHN